MDFKLTTIFIHHMYTPIWRKESGPNADAFQRELDPLKKHPPRLLPVVSAYMEHLLGHLRAIFVLSLQAEDSGFSFHEPAESEWQRM
jgi:hypothetical protein